MTDTNGMNDQKKPDVSWQKIQTDQNEYLVYCYSFFFKEVFRIKADQVQNEKHPFVMNFCCFEHIYGFEKSTLRTILTYISYILSIGWVRLLFHWYPRLHLYATHRKCALSRATKILAIDDYQGKYKSYFVRDIQTISTEDISVKNWLATLDTVDQDLVEKIRNKALKINLENGTQCEVREYKAFWCKKRCYIWDVTRSAFSKLVGYENGMTCSDFHFGSGHGLSKEEQLLRRIVYGNNEIVVPLQNIGVLLLLEILNPFYIFQVFTLSVWFAEGYYYYNIAIVLMSLFGITSSIVQTRKNQLNLRGTVASSDNVRVLRDDGTFENISSKDLVPGDIIELPKHQTTLVCDAVLLTGQCILNESMLTGESVPVTKTSLPSHQVLYDSKECTHYTLYSGTSIIQTRCPGDQRVLARIIRTGFLTKKGALIAAILYPPPADFKFDQDSYKFIGILAVIATCGFIYTIVSKVSRGITPGDIAIKALDIITIVVPPALPAAMTVGKLYAQARLKRAQIYCINNRVINVSGSINCVCFDKTGTLTEDGLDMWGIVPCTNGVLGEAETDVPKLENHPLFEGMLVCHSLTLIDGKLCGDPLDAKMFESTKWTLEESDCVHMDENDVATPMVVKPPASTTTKKTTSEIGIIQQYQFSSSLQRMTVIVRAFGSDDYRSYTKGSPEMIISLSKPETVPADIALALERYTTQGYRVIAMGRRAKIFESNMKISKLTREEVEWDLEFLGLVVLENRLKKPTTPVITELREANVRVVMITGDNIQTAMSVARQCGILSKEECVVNVTMTYGERKEDRPEIFLDIQTPQSVVLSPQNGGFVRAKDEERGIVNYNYKFALTGQTWRALREHYPDLIDRICVHSAIFARMSSDEKQQVVLELMRLGYYVAMCGDGANDCGALRSANVGISLSEAESSVASPFTSAVSDITCVPKVIREGRAALVTSFGIFKFMVAYSLTEFLSVITLYSIDSNLTDLQFLFIDICLGVNFAFFFGKTRAYMKSLSKTPPMTSLLSFTPLLSLTIHMFIMTVFQVAAYHAVREFWWFKPFVPTSNTGYMCYENYSVYCVSMFQYITFAIIFSRGKPYRRAIYTNRAFMSSILLLTIVCVYITIYPANWVVNALELILPPVYDWRFIILVLALANFLICFFIESVIIERIIENTLKRRFYKPEKSSKLYVKIEHEEKEYGNWPPFGEQLPIRKEDSMKRLVSVARRGYRSANVSGDRTINSLSNSSDLSKEKTDEGNGIRNPAFVKDEI